jgi:hypothetical protein
MVTYMEDTKMTIKNMIFAAVLGLGLLGCDDGGLGGGGADATGVDGGGTAVDAQSACKAVSASHFGGSVCLLRVPSGVECATARLFVGDVEVQLGEFSRTCDGAEPQLQVAGAACSRLESHAVATIGCL